MPSHDDYKDEPFLATTAIGNLLRRGCLNLFLGAGASTGFGLPNWSELVARILGKEKDQDFLKQLAVSFDQATGLLDQMDDGSPDYHRKVHKSLYGEIQGNLCDQLSRSPLLLAVAALVTGSCRGRIQQVFTYNYDDLLEQYLAMLGSAYCVRTAPSDFSTRADVEINHVHGFLPKSWDGGLLKADLILSNKSFRVKRAAIDEGWSLGIESSLNQKAGLFLGLSGSDGSILDLLKRVQKKLNRNNDYNGYWLLTPEAYDKNAKDIIDVKMCPVPLEREKLPEFVFRVCQEAAQSGL